MVARKLLIITDRADGEGALRALMGHMSQFDPFSVDCCDDAVGMLSKHTFDCVILEVCLRSKVDFELLRMMKEERLSLDEKTPVVVVTDSEAIATALEKSELTSFISTTLSSTPQKPLDPASLLAAIQA